MKIQLGLLTGILLAGIAVHTQQAVSVAVPPGALVFFDRTTATGCSTGWTELTAARGYYLTAMVSGGTRGTAVGTALTNQEDRTHVHTIAHTHTYSFNSAGPTAAMPKRPLAVVTVSDNVHAHLLSGTTGGSDNANSGTQSATLLPYLQYLICKRS